ELIRRCVGAPGAPARTLQRVERAMTRMAPMLFGRLDGRCPECDRDPGLRFDPQHFVLKELCEEAALVYVDVHLIALAYHWPESRILALPSSRRRRYGEMVRQAGRS